MQKQIECKFAGASSALPASPHPLAYLARLCLFASTVLVCLVSYFIATGTAYSTEAAAVEEDPMAESTVPGPQAPSAPIEFDRDRILDDRENRVSGLFDIPPDLRSRVGFWFDIYTKYTSNHRVIHHSKYPWVVFKSVDVSPIIFSDSPKRRWQRNQKADAHVEAEFKRIKRNLVALATRRGSRPLTAEESEVFEILKQVPGKTSRIAAEAANMLRVQTGQKDFFASGLAVSTLYLPTMERIFEEHRLPPELTRLPFVESSFNHLATSKAGAAGVWQFVNSTGRKFMIVDANIDERRSPMKSTVAAARLLKENHMIMYREWPLAITAYNHGPAGVKKAVRAAGTKDFPRIIRVYQTKSFNFATSNYYPSFLAALHAEKYHSEIFGPQAGEILFAETIKLPQAMRPSRVLTITGLSIDGFLLYNPDLKAAVKKDALLPRGFTLHLPPDSKRTMHEQLVVVDAKRGKKRT